jgi:hypothetical protein
MQTCRRATCLLGIVLTIGLASCDHDDPKKFPGEYAYRGKQGHVESLNFTADGTFRHELYADEKTFVAHGKPLFSLQGKWTFKDGRRTAQLLELHPVLYPFTEPPIQVYYGNLPWTPWFDYKPAIVFDENQFYWLVKIAVRADLRKVEFRYP